MICAPRKVLAVGTGLTAVAAAGLSVLLATNSAAATRVAQAPDTCVVTSPLCLPIGPSTTVLPLPTGAPSGTVLPTTLPTGTSGSGASGSGTATAPPSIPAPSGFPTGLPTGAPTGTFTHLTVKAHQLIATAEYALTAGGPGLPAPSGWITFAQDGRALAAVAVSNGAATLAYTVPTDKAHRITATFGGLQVGSVALGSSHTAVTRYNPSLTVRKVSRVRPRHGVYHAPVTVRFHCAAHGAKVTSCTGAKRLTRNGKHVVVGRAVAADGGARTVRVVVRIHR